MSGDPTNPVFASWPARQKAIFPMVPDLLQAWQKTRGQTFSPTTFPQSGTAYSSASQAALRDYLNQGRSTSAGSPIAPTKPTGGSGLSFDEWKQRSVAVQSDIAEMNAGRLTLPLLMRINDFLDLTEQFPNDLVAAAKSFGSTEINVTDPVRILQNVAAMRARVEKARQTLFQGPEPPEPGG